MNYSSAQHAIVTMQAGMRILQQGGNAAGSDSPLPPIVSCAVPHSSCGFSGMGTAVAPISCCDMRCCSYCMFAESVQLVVIVAWLMQMLQ